MGSVSLFLRWRIALLAAALLQSGGADHVSGGHRLSGGRWFCSESAGPEFAFSGERIPNGFCRFDVKSGLATGPCCHYQSFQWRAERRIVLIPHDCRSTLWKGDRDSSRVKSWSARYADIACHWIRGPNVRVSSGSINVDNTKEFS